MSDKCFPIESLFPIYGFAVTRPLNQKLADVASFMRSGLANSATAFEEVLLQKFAA